MKIALDIDRTAAIAAGREPVGRVVVDIDPAALTLEEREAVIAAPVVNGITSLRRADAHGSDARDALAVPLAHADDPLATIRHLLAEASARRAARLVAEAAKTAATNAKWAAHEAAWIADPEAEADYLLRDHMSAAGAAEYTRRQQAKEAERLAVKAEQEARLLAWAAVHGSETLRARIQENFSWQKLARQEFTAACAPEGYSEETYQRGSDANRTAPDLSEIQALREARKIADASDGVLSNPRLVYVTESHEHDDECDYDCEAKGTKWSRLDLTITAPDGSCVTVGRIIREL